jgi:4-amino-4-deoxychorismate lyase
MSLLIESIYLKDGSFRNLSYHQQRVDEACMALFAIQEKIDLKQVLSQSNIPQKGLYKCRIVFDMKVHKIEFQSYAIRKIKSLKMVDCNSIDYRFKFENREAIDNLFSQRQLCDDVLIIKDGLITDASYANIVFKLEDNWVTPNMPLLKGTMRQQLLDNGVISEATILRKDIHAFTSFKLINSMIGFDMPEIPVINILADEC